MITEIHFSSKGSGVLLRFQQSKKRKASELLNELKLTNNSKISVIEHLDEIQVTLLIEHVNDFLISLVNAGHLTFDTPILPENKQRMPLGIALKRLYIPTAPIDPDLAVKGFNVKGYWPLIKSLPRDERVQILKELESEHIIEKAERLVKVLNTMEPIPGNKGNSRDTFLAALLCLQQNKISINQLATIHLLDSAIETLHTAPLSHLVYKFTVNGDQHIVNSITGKKNPIASTLPIQQFHYQEINTPNDETLIEDMPWRMRKPLVSRFFNFTDSEWKDFCQELDQAPESEQYACALVAPEFGCWSSLVAVIQKNLKCMKTLDWLVDSNSGLKTETIMLVPSYSMFEAAIKVKAKTFQRTPVSLLPTYYFLNGKAYSWLKSIGVIPLTMYLPELDPSLRYQLYKGRFRTDVHGHVHESAFAGFIHDIYHAFREMAMSENVAAAIKRLATVAKGHPKNKLNNSDETISRILIDGELLFNYDPSVDTVFEEEYRTDSASIFGDLFYCNSLYGLLHDDLKRAFIHDMVTYKDEWLNSFKLGRGDLRDCDKKIYDSIEIELEFQQKLFKI